MLLQAFEKLLQVRLAPTLVRELEAGGDATPHWAVFEESGFLDLMVAEKEGGAGLPLRDAFPFIVALGRHAVALPIAQTIAARALVGATAQGMVTLAPALVRGQNGNLRAPQVPFGHIAARVLGWDGERLLLLEAANATRTPSGVHASLQAMLEWNDPRRVTLHGTDGEGFEVLGAALHAALLTGAMQRTFDLTLAYCNDRVQFGRSIGKFQAVQHQLSVMAEHVVASSLAAEAAFTSGPRVPALFAAAAAKTRASEAAPLVANAAHALHGAIGITEEYDLQLLTRRLHEWRMAHGSELHWSGVLGDAVLTSGKRLSDFVREI